MRKLSLMFPVPPCPDPDKSPASALSHILGHEGPGSVFAVLQNLGWISSLSAGLRAQGPDFGLFQVEVNLTPQGEKVWPQVVQVTMEQCRNLREATTSDVATLRRLWEEAAKLSQMHFETASPTGVYDLSPRLSQSILRYGALRCLSSGSQLEESGETLPLCALTEFMKNLTVDNLLVERSSEAAWSEAEKNPNAKLQKEQWYGIDFYTEVLGEQVIQDWNLTGVHPELGLPGPNRFIPRTLDLCPDLPEEARRGPRIEKEMDPPNLLVENRMGKLWHRLDDRYAPLKSALHCLISECQCPECVG